MARWDLFKGAAKSWQQRLNRRARWWSSRCAEAFAIKVIGGRSAAKREGRVIVLRAAEVQSGEARCLAEKEHEQPRCKWIERSPVTDARLSSKAANFGNHIVARWPARLINEEQPVDAGRTRATTRHGYDALAQARSSATAFNAAPLASASGKAMVAPAARA